MAFVNIRNIHRTCSKRFVKTLIVGIGNNHLDLFTFFCDRHLISGVSSDIRPSVAISGSLPAIAQFAITIRVNIIITSGIIIIAGMPEMKTICPACIAL